MRDNRLPRTQGVFMICLGYRLKLAPLSQCEAGLSKEEWQYAQGLSAKRAAQFSNGRALVRRLLTQHLQLTSAEINISLPSEQAPILSVDTVNWYLSISHSAQAIAVAISPNNCLGLDIEQSKSRNFNEFATEYAALAGAESLTGFYQRWTAAEAYSKYSGIPLLEVLQRSIPAGLPTHYLPLNGYMLCLSYQHADAELTITEDL